MRFFVAISEFMTLKQILRIFHWIGSFTTKIMPLISLIYIPVCINYKTGWRLPSFIKNSHKILICYVTVKTLSIEEVIEPISTIILIRYWKQKKGARSMSIAGNSKLRPLNLKSDILTLVCWEICCFRKCQCFKLYSNNNHYEAPEITFCI